MPRQTLPETASPLMGHLDAGLEFYTRGHYSAAVRCYHLALCREPGSALGHYLLGLALMARGDAANARAEWETVSRSEDMGPQTGWARRQARTLLAQVPDGL